MLLIGLAGAAGSGKDTVADYLVEQYGFVKFSFSDELYREVSEAFNVPIEELQDRNNKEKPHPQLTAEHCADNKFCWIMIAAASKEGAMIPRFFEFSPRWVLQHWGTEYRRAQDPDYWTKRTALWVKAFLDVASEGGDRPLGLVNTSVRFPNEQALIHELGGTVWHLRRFADEAEHLASGVGSELSHVAEQGLPRVDGDRELFNNGTVEQLRTAVTLLLQAPLEENPELAVDPGSEPETSYPEPVLIECSHCGKLHTGISRAQAEHEVAVFNAWFDQQSPEMQELYGNKHVTTAHYEGCMRCGRGEFHKFEPKPSADNGFAATVSPVIYEGAK
jgi:hypothetical protein